MPNMRSAAKRVRADRKLHLRNLQVQSEIKSLVRKFRESVQAGQSQQAREAFRFITRRLDQAASKKIIPPNTASRKQARLARALTKLAA